MISFLRLFGPYWNKKKKIELISKKHRTSLWKMEMYSMEEENLLESSKSGTALVYSALI